MLLLEWTVSARLIPGEQRLTLLVGYRLSIRDHRLRFVRLLRLPGEVLEGRLDLEQPLIVPRLISDFHSVIAETRGNQRVRVHYHSC